MKKIIVIRIIMMLIGNLLVGFGISLFRISNFGTDPFTTMNLGISSFFDISFGVYQLLVNVILVILVCFIARQHIGIGTLVNMVGIGFISDFFVYNYENMFEDNLSFIVRLIILVFALIIMTSGFSLYMTASLGIAPYDAIALIIKKISNDKVPFALSRIMTDVTCVLIGFTFGAVVGISTLITAFFTGPLVQFFMTYLWGPLLRLATKQKV